METDESLSESTIELNANASNEATRTDPPAASDEKLNFVFKSLRQIIHEKLFEKISQTPPADTVKIIKNNQFSSTERMRRKLLRDIAFDRECKKTESVWAKRGLPVDKDTLCSTVKKDAFDLTGLEQSLPSASAPVSSKPSGLVEFRSLFYNQSTAVKKERSEIKGAVMNCRINKGSFKSFRNFYDIEKNYARFRYPQPDAHRCSPVKITYSRFIPLNSQMEPARDEQKETSQDNESLTDNLQNFEKLDFTLKSFFSPMSTEMSHENQQDGEKTENQTPDVENNQQNFEFPRLLKLPDEGLSTGWDTERNWVTDFQIPGPSARMPPNSPIKGEGSADESIPIAWLEKVKREVVLIRDTNRLTAVNSRRGVLVEDEDGLEIDEPSSAPVTTSLNVRQFKLSPYRSMLREMKETIKSIRSFKRPISLSSMKVDKVIQDD